MRTVKVEDGKNGSKVFWRPEHYEAVIGGAIQLMRGDEATGMPPLSRRDAILQMNRTLPRQWRRPEKTLGQGAALLKLGGMIDEALAGQALPRKRRQALHVIKGDNQTRQDMTVAMMPLAVKPAEAPAPALPAMPDVLAALDEHFAAAIRALAGRHAQLYAAALAEGIQLELAKLKPA